MMREVRKARASEGTVLGNLGVAHVGLSQYHQAITYFEQAREILHEVGTSG